MVEPHVKSDADAIKTECRRLACQTTGISDIPLDELNWRQWSAFYDAYDVQLRSAGLDSLMSEDQLAKIRTIAAADPDGKPPLEEAA